MKHKIIPYHLRIGSLKSFYQNWYHDSFYSKLWWNDFKFRKLLFFSNKKNAFYKLARIKKKTKKFKSLYVLSNLTTSFSFFKRKAFCFSHVNPKKGKKAFSTPFYPAWKNLKKSKFSNFQKKT